MNSRSLNNLFNATTQATQFYGNEIIKLQEQRAQAATRTAMLDYQAAQQKFLQELSTSNDFGNWEAKADNFLTEQSNKLQANAASPLTAKYLQQAMEQNRAGLMLKVNEYAFNGIQKDIKAYNERSLATMRDQLSGKEGQETSTALLDDMLINGQIEQAECDQERRKNAMHFAGKEMNELAGAIVSNAVQNGKSLEEIKATISEACTNLPEVDNEEYYGSEAKSSCISGALKYAEAKYENELKSLQTENKKLIDSAYVVKMRNTTPGEALREYIKANGRAAVENMLGRNPNALSESDRMHFLALFEPDKIKDDETGASKTVSKGNGKATTDMNEAVKNLLNGVRSGSYSEYGDGFTGHQAIKFLNSVYLPNLQEAYGLTEQEARQIGQNAHYQLIDGLKSLYLKDSKGGENSAANQTVSMFEAAVKEFAQNNNLEYNGAMDSLEPWFVDKMAEIDFTSEKDLSRFRTETLTKIGSYKMGALEARAKGDQESSAFLAKNLDQDGNIKGNSDKILWEAMKELQGEKISFSNINDTPNYISPYASEAIDKVVDPAARSALSALTGIAPEKFIAQWESDGAWDYTGKREYVVGRDVYTFEYKNNKWPKADENIILKNGKQIATDKDLSAKRKLTKAAEENARQSALNETRQRKTAARESNINYTDTQMNIAYNKAQEMLDNNDERIKQFYVPGMTAVQLVDAISNSGKWDEYF